MPGSQESGRCIRTVEASGNEAVVGNGPPGRRANLATTKDYGSIRAMTPDALSAALERIASAASGALELRAC